jgi:glycosyltransferase involved in cell wall biosynthesis
MKLSIIVPVYNEEKNLPAFFNALAHALQAFEYEVIVVNDGSQDKSLSVLKGLASNDKRIKVIDFRGNFGQTAALSAGITESSGDIIIPIDSDMENDPADIPRLLKKLDEGYDVVSGWRQHRWEGQILRKIPSHMANWLISRITKVYLHDYGCTLKAYRRDVIVDVPLYGEMHRFIPALAAGRGARVTEIPVSFKPRIHGSSNYGISRSFKVLLDLLVIRFLDKYLNKPIHFFGGLGFYAFGIGLLSMVGAVYARFAFGTSLIQTPLPTFAAMCVIVGVQLVVMGVLSEMIMRTYYESRGKHPYMIRERINF